MRILITTLLAVCLTQPSSAIAGDSWNMSEPSVSEVSRQGSASLLDGASQLFAALANSERENALLTEQFEEAAARLYVAGKYFSTLSASEFANLDFPFEKLEGGGELYSWMVGVLGEKTPPIDEIKVSDLLTAAAEECNALAGQIAEEYSESYPNPFRTKRVVDRYLSLISAGTLAAVGFDLMR